MSVRWTISETGNGQDLLEVTASIYLPHSSLQRTWEDIIFILDQAMEGSKAARKNDIKALTIDKRVLAETLVTLRDLLADMEYRITEAQQLLGLRERIGPYRITEALSVSNVSKEKI